MTDMICPFSAPLVAGNFACRQAEAVIRRGGTEMACRAAASHTRCTNLHRALKAVALAEGGFEDDLTRIPHSLLVRIQYGGLLGLQRITADSGEPVAGVEDIDGLVQAALARYGTVGDIPCTEVCNDIAGCSLPGRRGRKR